MAGTTHFNIPMPVVGDTVADEFHRLMDETWPIVDAIFKAQLDAINGKAPFTHSHSIAGVVGLEAALEGKMPADRSFTLDDLNDVSGAVDAPANYILAKNGAGQWVPSTALATLGPHSHSLAEVAGLVAALSARPDRDEVADALEVISDDLAATSAALMTDIQQRGMPVGTLFFHMFPTPPSGSLALNGQAVTPVWPDLRTMILDMGAPWGMSGADPLLPDLITNGEFIRAGGPGGLTVGLFQLDAMQNVSGDLSDVVFGGSTVNGTGPFRTGTPVNNNLNAGGGQRFGAPVTFDLSRSARTAAETRPRAFVGLPCVKAFGTVDPEGMADLAELMTKIADRPTAEARASNTHLMTPLATGYAIAAYSKWETVGLFTATAATLLSVSTGLADFSTLVLMLDIEAISGSLSLGLQFGKAGGTWFTAANSYYGKSISSVGAGGSGGSQGLYTQIPLTDTMVVSAGARLDGSVRIQDFKQATNAVLKVDVTYAQPAGHIWQQSRWIHDQASGAVALDRLRLISSGATFTGKVLIEGVR